MVITGDGEQMMGIGSLATIAAKSPANLSIVVLDNGHYGETGKQKSHSSLGTDLVAVARGFGIAQVQQLRTLDRSRCAGRAYQRPQGHHLCAGVDPCR
ncbi:thiamine pyrophosphate-dependent enzyme [Comamonas sp. JC664]|uniref:thiamine pyrophosphate-dependent enzyme n=1 Tax=Comamonas sp. JC664 TaxID=2801917 RepID=UPI003609081F